MCSNMYYIINRLYIYIYIYKTFNHIMSYGYKIADILRVF